jgi:hypothetical protein
VAGTITTTLEVVSTIEEINGCAMGIIITIAITIMLNFRRLTIVREIIAEEQVDGHTTAIHILDEINEVTKI